MSCILVGERVGGGFIMRLGGEKYGVTDISFNSTRGATQVVRKLYFNILAENELAVRNFIW